MEECKALGGRLAYPSSAGARDYYSHLVDRRTLWVLNVSSSGVGAGECPALVAGEKDFRHHCIFLHKLNHGWKTVVVGRGLIIDFSSCK